MIWPRAIRPTRVESVLAVLLLVYSLAEATFSDEQPPLTAVLLLAAVVPPVAVAFSRRHPEYAASAMVAVLVLSSVHESPSGTLGAGFAWLAIAFGVAAWSRQPWPWVVALAVAGVVRDLRSVGYDATDVLIETVFIGFTVWIGRVVARRVALSDSLSRSLELADAERETLALEAAARERAQIARELHDIVAHSVSLIVVQAGTARPLAERVDQELSDVLATIEQVGRDALTELRRLLKVLRSDEVDPSQPVPSLDSVDALIDGMRLSGVEVRASLVVPPDVPAGVSLCAYRVVQEGLTNALRHARGSPIEVEVGGGEQTLRVVVRNRGRDRPGAGLGAGTGLIGLRERVLLCGGSLASGPVDGGYRLEAVLPMADAVLPSNAEATDATAP